MEEDLLLMFTFSRAKISYLEMIYIFSQTGPCIQYSPGLLVEFFSNSILPFPPDLLFVDEAAGGLLALLPDSGFGRAFFS